MTHPFIPPARPLIGEEEIEAVAAVMRTGMIAQGPQVAAFEEEFAAALVPGTRAAAVNSGTSALHLGLLAAGIGPGDEVIVPSFTFAATANSVAITGATPVFADIDPLTFTLSPAAVEAAITPRTRAIMPVHLYGHPAPMDALQEIADAHGLMVFEDAAQAHGASLHGRAVGVLENHQSVCISDRLEGVHGGGVAVEVDGHDSPRARRDRGLDGGRRQRERERVDVCEHGGRARDGDRVRGGREGEGGDDDLVARPDPGSEQSQVQGGGPRVDRDGSSSGHECSGELVLEGCHLRTLGDHARAHDRRDRIDLLLADERTSGRDERLRHGWSSRVWAGVAGALGDEAWASSGDRAPSRST